MRIVTFGSCLSRRVAERFVDTHGARLASSVYHTRSDFFLETFIDRTRRELSLELLTRLTTHPGEPSESPHILKNQCRETLGLHMLPEGVPFLRAMQEGTAELVLCDNYMDTAARLCVAKDGDREVEFFSTLARLAKGGILSPKTSAENFKRLLALFSQAFPKAFLVLLGFPWSPYQGAAQRKEWALEFGREISGVNFIPPVFVPEKYRTHEHAHYAPDFYLMYVGAIAALMTSPCDKPRIVNLDQAGMNQQ